MGLDKRLHNHMGPEQLKRFKEVSKGQFVLQSTFSVLNLHELDMSHLRIVPKCTMTYEIKISDLINIKNKVTNIRTYPMELVQLHHVDGHAGVNFEPPGRGEDGWGGEGPSASYDAVTGYFK